MGGLQPPDITTFNLLTLQNDPPWSPHSPLTTPLGLLTHLGQLIKSDLVWTDLGRSCSGCNNFVTEEEKKGTKCISMVVDYIRRKDIENNSWPFHSHVCSSLKIWSPNQTFLTLYQLCSDNINHQTILSNDSPILLQKKPSIDPSLISGNCLQLSVVDSKTLNLKVWFI